MTNTPAKKTIWEDLPEGPGRLTITFGNALRHMPLQEQARYLVNIWEAIAPNVREKYGVHAMRGQVDTNPQTKETFLTLEVIKQTPKPAP